MGFTSCRLNSKVLVVSEWLVRKPIPLWNWPEGRRARRVEAARGGEERC